MARYIDVAWEALLTCLSPALFTNDLSLAMAQFWRTRLQKTNKYTIILILMLPQIFRSNMNFVSLVFVLNIVESRPFFLTNLWTKSPDHHLASKNKQRCLLGSHLSPSNLTVQILYLNRNLPLILYFMPMKFKTARNCAKYIYVKIGHWPGLPP